MFENLDNIHYLLLIIIVIVLVMLYLCKIKNNNDVTREFAKLMVDNLTYTRSIVMSIFSDGAELNQLKDSLIRNQQEIGNALGKLFGFDIGIKITKLLTEQGMSAISISSALKTKDGNLHDHIKNYNIVSEKIGLILDELKGTKYFAKQMKLHASTYITFVTAIAESRYDDDIKAFNNYLQEGMDLAFEMAK